MNPLATGAKAGTANPDLPAPSIQRDEWDVLDALFKAEFDSVYRYCLARTGSREAAEDAASHTFVEAARLVRCGRGDEVQRAWLYTVAKRRLIDLWRSEERNRRRIARLHELSARQSTATDDPDGERVLSALASLPPRQRAALILRYLEEYSVDEVADSLDVTYKTAESLLSRGRRGFSRAFKETP